MTRYGILSGAHASFAGLAGEAPKSGRIMIDATA
jgi:hypothetical protein